MITTPHALSQQQRCLRRRLRDRLMLLCVVIVLSGCTTAQGDSLPTPNIVQPTVAGTNLSFTTIAIGVQIGGLFVDKPQVIIITNVQEVDTALRQAAGDPPALTRNPHPVEQARQIDYTHSFAILILQGWQGTSGYSVTVDQVVRQGDRVLIQATFVRPGGEDGTPEAHSAVITDPYHLIAIPKTGTWGLDVRFELVEQGNVVADATHFIP